MAYTEHVNRRAFISKAAGTLAATVGLPYVILSSAMGADGYVAPSNRIVMAGIGIGSMGGGHLRSFLGYKDVQMVAACELRKIFRDRAKNWIDQEYGTSDSRTYDDYREMLLRKDIDAVFIATTEHWHGLIAIEAARNGKHMYCEKALDTNFAMDRPIADAVNRYGVVFQHGTQQRSDIRFRHACELARNGRLGKLHTIMIGSLKSISFPNQPTEPEPPKEKFDYDTWLGPAPWKPYCYQRCASRAMGTEGIWFHIHDYCLGGISGAYGIHHVDIAQWGNGTDDTGPIEVEGTGTLPGDGLADTFLE